MKNWYYILIVAALFAAYRFISGKGCIFCKDEAKPAPTPNQPGTPAGRPPDAHPAPIGTTPGDTSPDDPPPFLPDEEYKPVKPVEEAPAPSPGTGAIDDNENDTPQPPPPLGGPGGINISPGFPSDCPYTNWQACEEWKRKKEESQRPPVSTTPIGVKPPVAEVRPPASKIPPITARPPATETKPTLKPAAGIAKVKLENMYARKVDNRATEIAAKITDFAPTTTNTYVFSSKTSMFYPD